MNRVLIAGIGNIFYGDDAFGVEVARQLTHRDWPAKGEGKVEVMDLGIRSYDPAYALTGGYEAAVLVDAVPRGLLPGTVSLIQPDLNQLQQMERTTGDAHVMDSVSVLQMARSLGGSLGFRSKPRRSPLSVG
jgi:hydrogenase maturation protease